MENKFLKYYLQHSSRILFELIMPSKYSSEARCKYSTSVSMPPSRPGSQSNFNSVTSLPFRRRLSFLRPHPNFFFVEFGISIKGKVELIQVEESTDWGNCDVWVQKGRKKQHASCTIIKIKRFKCCLIQNRFLCPEKSQCHACTSFYGWSTDLRPLDNSRWILGCSTNNSMSMFPIIWSFNWASDPSRDTKDKVSLRQGDTCMERLSSKILKVSAGNLIQR